MRPVSDGSRCDFSVGSASGKGAGGTSTTERTSLSIRAQSAGPGLGSDCPEAPASPAPADPTDERLPTLILLLLRPTAAAAAPPSPRCGGRTSGRVMYTACGAAALSAVCSGEPSMRPTAPAAKPAVLMTAPASTAPAAPATLAEAATTPMEAAGRLAAASMDAAAGGGVQTTEVAVSIQF